MPPFCISERCFWKFLSRAGLWPAFLLDSWTGKTADTELLRRCKEAITDVVPDATVILYGSRTRGDAGEYSDYDIMVVVNGPVDMVLEKKILDNIFPIELETGAVLTYIVYNKVP
ncbi:MAG: nucleotidyltransferase domain-containing protein [Sedimentisphaerales bacterium]|nr:nucleotidyltransferase domain-containing protein [Sedimentisphaerales bacterium]